MTGLRIAGRVGSGDGGVEIAKRGLEHRLAEATPFQDDGAIEGALQLGRDRGERFHRERGLLHDRAVYRLHRRDGATVPGPMGDPTTPAAPPGEGRRCATCAAFTRTREDAQLGRVGECALEVFAPPLRATALCTKWRAVGALAPPPRARAAGEPRRRDLPRLATVGSGTAPRGTGASPSSPTPPPLPQEIDIDMDIDEFRRVLREVIANELGVSRPAMGARWQGGELVLKPGREGTQEKRVPIESFFSKVVMVRDKLRLLEAKVNAHPGLSPEDKVQLQAYVTGCYGSLTTFNVLFSEKGDQFSGAGGRDE